MLPLWLLLASLAFAGPVDLNSASAAELETLPGIGAAKAQAIVDWRAKNGAFQSVEQLDLVPGIGMATISALRDAVTVSGVAPSVAAPAGRAPWPEGPTALPIAPQTATATGKVNLNKATLAELQALPGMGPTKAKAIVEDREKNGPFSSCADLSRVPGIGAATVSAIADRCTTGP